MKDYKRHIPDGLKDVLNNDVEIKQWIENVLRKQFKQYNYQFIETPTFEYLDIFTLGSKSYQNQDLYTWVNRQGELVALRSDQTKAIARVIANNYATLDFPKRYAYISPTFRCPKAYQGKMHEFTQAGIELVGDQSLQSEIEIIVLAIEAIKACGISDFTIHIGSATFLNDMLATVGLTDDDRETIDQAIKAKDAVSIRKVLESYQDAKSFIPLILDLMQTSGKIELLRSIKEKLTHPILRQSLERLEKLYEQLVRFGVSNYILFDFSILSYASYYTGMMFQGYTQGVGQVIVEGGRYDTLLENYDIQLPAIGMAINVNLLVQKYQDLQIPVPERKKILIVWEDEQLEVAIQLSRELRENGKSIQYALNNDYSQQLTYAQQIGIDTVIYLKDDNRVVTYEKQRLINDVTVEEWIKTYI